MNTNIPVCFTALYCKGRQRVLNYLGVAHANPTCQYEQEIHLSFPDSWSACRAMDCTDCCMYSGGEEQEECALHNTLRDEFLEELKCSLRDRGGLE